MASPILENPPQHLLSRLDSDMPRQIIGLVGVPGSGKSTLAAHLAAEVNARTTPDTMVALGIDGFHLTLAALKQRPDGREAIARRGAPWTFAPHLLAQRLQETRRASGCSEIGWPTFQHDVGDPVENGQWIAPHARLVLIEGLYLLHPADGWETIASLLDTCWYLDTPLEIAMERLANRHMAAWNFTREQAEARIAINDRLNAEIVLQSHDRADRRILL